MNRFKDKVLAVDDDPVNLKIIGEALSDKCQLKLISSGDEALVEIPKFKPDVVLLDIMMPGLNGYETCQKIKIDPVLKFTKILLISAKAMVSDRLLGYDTGADDYITKPFNDDELLAKVKVYLRMKFLEEMEELRRNTLTSIAQNVRNPLMSILGTGSMVTEKDMDEWRVDQLKSQLEHMRASNVELMNFCNKAMLLCELKDGREMALEKVAVEEVVGDVIKSFIVQSREKGMKISYKNMMNQAISMDAQLVESALSGILQNAITYSPLNAEINMLSMEKNDHCVIMIEDQGSGLVQRVFKEISANESRTYQTGEGVGLNVAQIIAQLHGGKVSYTTNAKWGMTFYFSIPI